MKKQNEKDSDIALNQYLLEKTKDKSCISIAELKRSFPKEKAQIDKLKFLGLLEIVSPEFPDTVRAHIYS